MIDITNYAQALNGKPSKSLNDLSQAGEDHFYENDFTILYPNGTAANPASISLNTRVVVNNPFPGYLVYCVAEIYRNSMWGITGFVYDGGGRGILASQYDDDSIVVQSGDTYVVTGPSNTAGNPYGTGNGTGLTSAPYRVKVWKIGKIPQSS